MSEILLFHHAQGLTQGVLRFAERLRSAGHVVHTPDLYEGHVFATLGDGITHAQTVGFEKILERGRAAAAVLPSQLVYAGFSLGVLAAQMLTQSRPGSKGGLFFSACVPASEFGPWPNGVAAQIHAMDSDDIFVNEGDLSAARALAEDVDGVELFLYEGAEHLFADDGLPSYNRDATELLYTRVVRFLTSVA